MFGAAARPQMTSGPTSYKYPAMLPSFRSQNVPGMWFAGTLSHALVTLRRPARSDRERVHRLSGHSDAIQCLPALSTERSR
jgi:hypothetical protein